VLGNRKAIVEELYAAVPPPHILVADARQKVEVN
jgi:hypothetical protein